MPRRARLALPGIPWHIIQRGNNRNNKGQTTFNFCNTQSELLCDPR